MADNLVNFHTPFEIYQVDGKSIWVKREDLSCPLPGPQFSKIRGIYARLQKYLDSGMFDIPRVAVVDSVHSRAGWGVSYLAKALNIFCTVFYPYTKFEGSDYVRPYQQWCRNEFGAEIIGLPATMSSVLFYQARKIYRENYPTGFMLPNGLKLSETISETARVVAEDTPAELLIVSCTWVVSVSSGTIAFGVAAGLRRAGFKGRLILHLGYSRNSRRLLNSVQQFAQQTFDVSIIDERYQYKDAVNTPVPFPCNPYYDRKAWKWLIENKIGFDGPIVFWNIGA